MQKNSSYHIAGLLNSMLSFCMSGTFSFISKDHSSIKGEKEYGGSSYTRFSKTWIQHLLNSQMSEELIAELFITTFILQSRGAMPPAAELVWLHCIKENGFKDDSHTVFLELNMGSFTLQMIILVCKYVYTTWILHSCIFCKCIFLALSE